MALPSKKLRDRASAALHLVKETKPVLGSLDIAIDERSATVIPLVLASMDAAEAIYALLINQPEESWVPALILQRSQIEHVLRAAYFAKAASHKELMSFRRNGRMPSRGKRAIYVAEVARTQAGTWAGDVPPPLSSAAIWSPIPNDKEIGREEAFYRRTDHRLPA